MSEVGGIPPNFQPTKVIVLSELTSREKEKYFQFLLLNQTKFRREYLSSNSSADQVPEVRYIANIRLLAPNVRKPEEEKKKKETSNYAITFQERLVKLRNEGFIQVNVVNTDPGFDYRLYPRFTSLIANRFDTVRPKLRPMTWVMKYVEDIYDARFEHEKNDVEREDDAPSFDLILLIFPVFVVRRLGTNKGLKSIVDQMCWDLLYSVIAMHSTPTIQQLHHNIE